MCEFGNTSNMGMCVCGILMRAGPSAGTSTVLSSLEATTRLAGGHSTIQAFELPDSQLTHRLVRCLKHTASSWGSVAGAWVLLGKSTHSDCVVPCVGFCCFAGGANGCSARHSDVLAGPVGSHQQLVRVLLRTNTWGAAGQALCGAAKVRACVCLWGWLSCHLLRWPAEASTRCACAYQPLCCGMLCAAGAVHLLQGLSACGVVWLPHP